MIAVRVKPLADASISAMLDKWWVLNPLIEESSVLSVADTKPFEDLLMMKAIS